MLTAIPVHPNGSYICWQLSTRIVKWTQHSLLLLAGIFTTGCNRPVPTPLPNATPPDVITVQVRVSRARDALHGVVLAAPTLTADSGKQATYDIGALRLVVQPTSNGDKTVTVRAILYEHADTKTPDIIDCPDTTIADGETATNQINAYTFSFSPKINDKKP